jgi:hypothetical protein
MSRRKAEQAIGAATSVLALATACGLAAGGPVDANDASRAGPAAIALADRTVRTARHRIALAETGLPAQIVIEHAADELPLELRGRRGRVPADLLRQIGRGEQLASPIRIEAVVEGEPVAAKPAAAAKIARRDGAVHCAAKLAAGPVGVALDLRYGAGGGLSGTIAYQAAGGRIDELALVVDLAGMVDTVVPGEPAGQETRAIPRGRFDVPPGDGLVWGNALADAGDANRAAPGVPARCFVGSGDRGFTWLTDESAGWVVDPSASVMTLRRDEGGRVRWRIRLVNHPAAIKGQHKVSFALLTHPARYRRDGRRRAEWLAPGAADATCAHPDATVSGYRRAGPRDTLRADAAVVYEAKTRRGILCGPAGGAGLSRAQDLADTCPMKLFRYLAGTHTGLSARLVPNAAKLTVPGANPAPDRVAMGRALLHDVGLDAARIAHRTQALRVAAALRAFGYFEADGKTEFLPYWRNASAIRFGAAFEADSAFELTTSDPLARVRTSVYRRPAGTQGAEALIVVLNETDRPVREQLYILDPARIFGGENTIRERDICSQYDFSRMPPQSDWGRGPMLGRRSAGGKGGIVLEDVENHGIVQRPAAKDGTEVYGPVYVPAHGFRLLRGHRRAK